MRKQQKEQATNFILFYLKENPVCGTHIDEFVTSICKECKLDFTQGFSGRYESTDLRSLLLILYKEGILDRRKISVRFPGLKTTSQTFEYFLKDSNGPDLLPNSTSI